MTMPDTPIATDINEALDIKGNLFSKLSLNLMLPVDKLAEAINLLFSEVTGFNLSIDTSLS